MKQCPYYSINSRCQPKCGAREGRCIMQDREEWCILKVEGKKK